MSLKDTVRFSGTIAGLKVEGRFTVEGLKQVGRFDNGTTPPPTFALPPLNLSFDGFAGDVVNVNKSVVAAVDPALSSGAGSYADAPNDSFMIFPGKSGNITIPDGSSFTKDCFVLGQTSDGGINFSGTAAQTRNTLMKLGSSDFIFSNVGFYEGETDGTNGQNRTLDIENQSTAVNGGVIHQCMFGYGDDHIASAWFGTQNVSWLENIFARGVNGFQSNYPLVIGGGSGRLTFARNFIGGKDRCPNIQNTGLVEVTNNIIEYESNGVSFQHISNKPFAFPDLMTGQCTHNLFVLVGSSSKDIGFHIRSDAGGVNNPNMEIKVFLDENYRMSRGDNPAAATAAIPGMYSTSTGPSPHATQDPNDYLSSTAFGVRPFAKLDPRTELSDFIVNNAGPQHRDSIAQAVIDEFVAGTVPLVSSTVAGYGGHTTPTAKPPITIWNSGQVDYIDPDIKVKWRLPAGANTTQTFSNGGVDGSGNPVCDFLAILNAEGIL